METREHLELIYTTKHPSEVIWCQEKPYVSLQLLGVLDAMNDTPMIDIGRERFTGLR